MPLRLLTPTSRSRRNRAGRRATRPVGMLDPDAHYYFEAAPSADYLDFGSNGIFGDAIGQEITSFEATQDLFAPRVSYEAQTFGW